MQVLQEYVKDLLLLQGHKCHIRVHVLVTGAVEVSIAEQCLVLPAVAAFDAAAGDDLLIHATNHAVWSKNSQYCTLLSQETFLSNTVGEREPSVLIVFLHSSFRQRSYQAT